MIIANKFSLPIGNKSISLCESVSKYELFLFEMKTLRFQKLFKKIFVHCVIPNLSCGFLQYYTDSTFFAWFKVCCSKNTVENIHAHTSDREQKIGFYRHGEVVSLTLIISAKFSNYTASKWQFSFFVPFFRVVRRNRIVVVNWLV